MKTKNIIIKIFSIILLCLFLTNFSFAEYKVDANIEKIFGQFLIKLEKKYTIEKEIVFLENLNSKIYIILKQNNLSETKKKLLSDLSILSNEKIFNLKTKKDLENYSQKILEANILNETKNKLNLIKINNNFNTIGKNIIKISDNFEFIENNKIKKINFTKFYDINLGNYHNFKNKNGIILAKSNGKYLFVEQYSFEEKIAYSNLHKYTKGFITEENKYFEENNIFYTYNFANYNSFKDKYGIYKSVLEKNKIFLNKTILYLGKDKKYNFITDYKKNILINGDIIYGITDKKTFLQNIVDDKEYLTGDTDDLFIKLKDEVLKLTKGKTEEETIKVLYNFILYNLEYPIEIDLSNKSIYSGILTYKNKSGVCEGYAKLFSYSLQFAGISGVKVLGGDVIDSLDFPKIGHAWIKIGDLYYDPTFDDPIGNNKTLKFEEYKYFALPRDLFYVNRFDYGTAPEYLKTKSLEYREKFVYERLSKLYMQYFDKKYLILEPIKFNKKNNIDIGKKISIEDLKKIMSYYDVEEKSNGEFVFYENGKKRNITEIDYYIVDDSNLGQVLSQLDFNLDGLYLFKWKKVNGNFEYRIAFDVIIK